MANALATLSAMVRVNEGQEMTIHVRHCEPIEADLEPWYFGIKKYLEKGEYPVGALENSKRTLRRLAFSFLLSGVVLYKRNTDMTLLRCVDHQEAERIIEEVHEGTFGTHANGHALGMVLLDQAGIGLLPACQKMCEISDSCRPHQHGSFYVAQSHHSLALIHVGRRCNHASNGHRFILVVIDYFTKWVEAASYSIVTRGIVVRFIKKDIICRYGLPAHIIIDNDTNLNNKMMIELCEQFRIRHHNSTPYRRKMNGTVEAANKNIKKIIQKMVVTYKDWHEMLPHALHGYRTSVRTSTGPTPYSLVYGTEAVLPVEVKIPSLRVMVEVELDEAEWVQQRLDQLNLIEEK
ncbi:Pol polyprotein, partial [Mucuna pruriens]